VFERFTDRARRVVVLAQDEARLLSHHHIGTEHLFLGVLSEGEGLGAQALRAFDIDLEDVRGRVRKAVPPRSTPPGGHIPFTPQAKKVLELSLREALTLGHNYIGTEHILLGLIREGQGLAAQIITEKGHDLEDVRLEVVKVLKSHRGKSPEAMPSAPGEFTFRTAPLADKLERVQETLDRIERRLDAMGVPADPAPPAPATPDVPEQGEDEAGREGA
jgi:ATP-dependent Clp protease ATP-binding subunit ClpC